MLVKDARIEEQDSAYRRGLVLGLTMAEVMVLVLFTLLLALAAVLARKNEDVKKKDEMLATFIRDNPTGISVTDIVARIERQRTEIETLRGQNIELRKYESFGAMLTEINRKISRSKEEQLSAAEIVDRIKSATQIADSLAKAKSEIERLKSLEVKAQQLDAILAQVSGGQGDSAGSIREKLWQAEQSARQNETLKGQLAQLSRQIKSLGRGNDFPSCWVTQDGKTESIFELYITAEGVIIKDRSLAAHAKDKERLPIASIKYGSELSVKSFQEQLRPLFDWSVQNTCRFYVIIRSTVESAPIRTVNAVNQYFYPDSFIKYQPVR